MKVCLLGLTVLALAGASQVWAANGRPSNETLSAMGLSDLKVMTDAEGLSVRGMGWYGASAAGKSFAVVSAYGAMAGSTNGYSAQGKYKASGENESYAGVEVKQSGGYGGGHGNNSYGSSGGGHGSSGGGYGGKPKSIAIQAYSGGSSTGHRK
jgi:hypothetical protein